MRKRGYTGVLKLIIIAGFFSSSALRGGDDYNDELLQIKTRIEKERRELEEKEAEQGKILAQMELIEKKIRFYDEKIKGLEKKRVELLKEVRALEAEINKLKAELEQRKRILGERLKARYKMGEAGTLQVLFSSDSVSSLVLLDEYLGMIYEKDQELIQGYEDDLRRLGEKKRVLEEKKAKMDATIAGERWARGELDAEMLKKKELLDSIQREAEKHIEVISELDISAQQLEQKLRNLEKGRKKESEFVLFMGKLCMPVSGRIEEHFGEKIDPAFKTRTMRKGIDIRARKGEMVRAIYSGQVVYADWFRGYGNLVIIDHGSSYYSLYAHLDRIDKATGDFVKKGEVIGTVGETGSLKGAYLYFELRHHSEAVNPELWLNKGCVYRGK